jgi:hypothetical protein
MTDDTQAPPFDRGGWISGGPTPVTLDDAECILLPADVLAGTPVCRRRDQVHLDAAHAGEVPVRCPSCDHHLADHSEGGCWYTVMTGRVNANLVCACSVEPA